MQLKRTIATAVALAALSAPTAGARVAADVPVKPASTDVAAPAAQSSYAGMAAHRDAISNRHWQQANSTPLQPLTEPRGDGIDWPSALMGAAFLLALLLVSLLGRTLVSRRRTRTAIA